MDKKIVDILKKESSNGASITDLVKKTKLGRSSIRISLARLEGAKKISFRKVGMAKVYYLNKAAKK